MMNQQSNTRLQLFGAWSGLIAITFMLGGLLVAGFFPPTPPDFSAEQVASMYQKNFNLIRIGMIIVMVGSAFYLPWTAILAKILARIEGSPGILCYTQITSGVTNVLLTAYSAIWWIIASYRPDRNPELVQLINDAGWLQFLGLAAPYYFVIISVAIAAFCDKDPDPVFPRWVGYFNVWVFVLFIPLEIIFFVTTGPFAWNGLFGCYIPFVAFYSWYFIVFYYIRKAILKGVLDDHN